MKLPEPVASKDMPTTTCSDTCSPGAFCEFIVEHRSLFGWIPCAIAVLLLGLFTGAAVVANQRAKKILTDPGPPAGEPNRMTLMWLRYAKLAAATLLTLICIIAGVGFGCRCLALNWPLALVPSLIVVLYFFQQLMMRARRIQSVSLEPPYPAGYRPSTEAQWLKDLRTAFDNVAHQLRFAIGEHYSNPGVLLVRLGAPASLLLLVSSALLLIVAQDNLAWLNPGLNPVLGHSSQALTGLLLRGLHYGAAGAYVWVLLELTERCFRRDMTPGSVLWCAATLVIGPLLGAFLALVLKLEPKGDSIWQSALVLFFAGFAPRRIVEIASAAAQQMLRSTPNVVPNPNLIPLGTLRGVTPNIEDRLGQEGIQDAFMLAFADPVRLLRNTAFDLRQIVAWMDQSLLLVFCPRLVHGLAEAGITGATDLAFYEIIRRCHEEAASPGGAPPEDVFAALKKMTQIDTDVLRDAAQRLYYDEQVRLVWVLYNTFSLQPGDSDGTAQSNEKKA